MHQRMSLACGGALAAARTATEGLRRRAGAARRSRFSVLVRVFLRQFAPVEATASGGDLKQAVIAALCLLSGPGLFVSMWAVRGGPRLAVTHQLDGLHPLLWFWSEEWLLFVMSLVACAVLVAVRWRSLVLGARDYHILGALPVPRRTVLLARVASLLAVIGGVHVAVNALGGLVLPLVSPAGYLRTVAALQLALLAQTVFVCAAVLGLQALVTTVLPPALAERAATAVQAAVLLAVAVLLAAQDLLADVSYVARDTPHPIHDFVPVSWFLALYKVLLGMESPQMLRDAALALASTAAALAVAVPGCLLGYRDAEGRETRLERAAAGFASRLDELLAFRHPARPVAHAVSAFVSRALSRSASSALIARSWSVLGIGVTLAGFGGALLRGQLGAGETSPALLAPAFILPLFRVVGMRASGSYPVELEANWVFRLSESTGSASGDYHAGARAAVLRSAVLPVVAPLFAIEAVLWGTGMAVAHLAWALAMALLTIEWVFLGFRKVPFTCSYQPDKANVRARWPAAVLVAVLYCGALPEACAWALRRPAWWLNGLLALLVAWRVVAALGARQRRREPQLVFDDRPLPLVTTLGLDD